LTLEVEQLSQTMECVHLKEQPEDSSLHALYTVRCPEQVIFKLYGKSPSCFSARVPEVTSMQIFECIGEEWKIPTPDILA
jgi:hypothetical protein